MVGGEPCRSSVTLSSIPGLGYDRTAFCERDHGHAESEPHEAFVRAPGGETGVPPQWADVTWRFPASDGASNWVGENRPNRPGVPHSLAENDLVDGPNPL
jgi:hypothetical protein